MYVCDSQLNTSASGVAALHVRHGKAETSRTLAYCVRIILTAEPKEVVKFKKKNILRA